MAKLQSNKKLQNGRRNAKADEDVEKREAIIETIAKWIEALEDKFNAEILYNIDEIIFD